MKERPILFSAPMVQAFFANRKTQTRRIVNPQPPPYEGLYGDRYNKSERWSFWMPDHRMLEPRTFPCPFGDISDLVWVRETWKYGLDVTNDPEFHHFTNCKTDPKDGRKYIIFYRADYTEEDDTGDWRASIHLPRWASRLTMEIADVRVQRLQDITEEEAKAEGVAPNWGKDLAGWSEQEHGYYDYSLPPFWDGEGAVHCTARESFRTLWDSLYGKALNLKETHGWDANPWVWAITFKIAEGAAIK